MTPQQLYEALIKLPTDAQIIDFCRANNIAFKMERTDEIRWQLKFGQNRIGIVRDLDGKPKGSWLVGELGEDE